MRYIISLARATERLQRWLRHQITSSQTDWNQQRVIATIPYHSNAAAAAAVVAQVTSDINEAETPLATVRNIC